MRIVKCISGFTLAITCLTAILIAKLYEANNIEFGQAIKVLAPCVIIYLISFLIFIKANKEGFYYGKESNLLDMQSRLEYKQIAEDTVKRI